MFNTDAIYHMKESALAGVNHKGWGIPRTLVNLGLAVYAQTLRRYNEVLAMDYIVPFRVITPMPKAGGQTEGDPLLSMSMCIRRGSSRRIRTLR